MISQTRVRIAGVVTLGACALMAWSGVRMEALRESTPLFWAYWAVFLLLLLLTFYIVLIDIRYIRLRHATALRDAFHETLGDQDFRTTLRNALSEPAQIDPSKGRRN